MHLLGCHLNRVSTKIRAAATTVVAMLCAKVFVGVLYEYRWYFPANFEMSDFLFGRREAFVGLYPWAFYTHILMGPIAIVLGTWLMWSAKKLRLRCRHRWLGRMQVGVIALTALSGLVMAQNAATGAIAGLGFMALAAATMVSAVAMVGHAMGRGFRAHQRWATRCYILLLSPLLLRIVGGVTLVTGLGADWTYRLTAWLSWLVPLVVYESVVRWPKSCSSRDSRISSVPMPSRLVWPDDTLRIRKPEVKL